MVDAVEAACRAAGVRGGPPAPADLPQFDLLAHPAQWRLGQGFLAGASLPQLVALGQMTRWVGALVVVVVVVVVMVGCVGGVGCGGGLFEEATRMLLRS